MSLLSQLGYVNLKTESIQSKIQHYQREDYRVFVAERGDQVIAFISMHCFDIFHSPGKMGRITAFCVDEKFRNKGVGKLMLEAAEKYFIEVGCTKLEVTSNERRKNAHQFYLSQDWKIDSMRFVKYVHPSSL